MCSWNVSEPRDLWFKLASSCNDGTIFCLQYGREDELLGNMQAQGKINDAWRIKVMTEQCLVYLSIFFKVGQPRPLFVYFRSFQTQYYRKTIGFSRIRTRIVGVEGEHADHLTTTTAPLKLLYLQLVG